MGGSLLANGIHNAIIRNLTIRETAGRPGADDDANGDGGGDRDGVQMDTRHITFGSITVVSGTHLGDGQRSMNRMDTTFETVPERPRESSNKTYGIGSDGKCDGSGSRSTTIDPQHDPARNPELTDNVLRAHLFNNVMEELPRATETTRAAGTNMALQNSASSSTPNNPHYYDAERSSRGGNLYRGTTGQQESSGTTFSFFLDPGRVLTRYGASDPASAV